MDPYENPWIYKGKVFTDDDIGDQYGFVYQIENLVTGRLYIGKKFFYTSKTKQVNKKRKRYKVISDYKEYYGSNDELKKDVALHGPSNFKREILRLCKSKGAANYYEAKVQFSVDAILKPGYYNTWITVKVNKVHVLEPD